MTAIAFQEESEEVSGKGKVISSEAQSLTAGWPVANKSQHWKEQTERT